MGKVFIKLEQDNLDVDKVSATYRKDAAAAMFKALRKALQAKCQIDLDPKPQPAAGLSLSGAVESITLTTMGQQVKVQVKINLQLALWPAVSKKSNNGESMFGMMTGSATTSDGASAKQVQESVLFALAEASKDTIQKRIDAGIQAWQARTNTKLDVCEVKP